MATTTAHRAFPVDLNVAGRPVVVVGGGPIAARKIAGLRAAGAVVTVVAPEAVSAITQDPDVIWRARPYRRGDLDGCWLAVTATNDPEVNRCVAADGEQARVWVNSADDPANCSFTLPAVARHGGIQIAISTGGRSPALAKWLRARAERDLQDGYGELLDLLAQARSALRERNGTSEVPGWGDALDDGLLEEVRANRIDHARVRLFHHLGFDGIPPWGSPPTNCAHQTHNKSAVKHTLIDTAPEARPNPPIPESPPLQETL